MAEPRAEKSVAAPRLWKRSSRSSGGGRHGAQGAPCVPCRVRPPRGPEAPGAGRAPHSLSIWGWAAAACHCRAACSRPHRPMH